MISVNIIQKNGETKTIQGRAGLSLMEVALAHDVETIRGVCGGSLGCATCHFWVAPEWYEKSFGNDDIDGGEMSEGEHDMLDTADPQHRLSRLSCQIILKEELDGLVVAIPGAKVDWA
ncbi:MAG: 2Fe-2S iron-sulfur cluster binding domain-containing protein [Alphaproteobacteria bacterium]|nr:2Fe-2S iron-sulfur cluster binding domain-containing protein [Alphaproteobacteria bacterium]